MRRPIVLLAALVLAIAAYGAYWYSVAELVRGGILDWSASRRSAGFTIGWDRYDVTGFPFALRVTVERPVFGQSGIEPGYEGRAPVLIAEAQPWALKTWRVTAESGVTLNIQPGPARPAISIAVAALTGTVMPRADDEAARNPGDDITLAAAGITIVGQVPLAIARASVRTTLPARRVVSHLESWLGASIALDGVTLPDAVPPLGNTIDHVAATLTVKGSIANGPHRQALVDWRDEGGTLEVEAFDLQWGKLALAAQGTLALDAALQPLGALTATIGGYAEIIDALVAADKLKAGEGAMAKLALGLLAKPGPNGVYQLSAPLNLQNGQGSIGPIRLARMPNFTWE
jgi:hypothetical protein